METKNAVYPNGTYVCVRYKSAGDKGRNNAATGFIKDDDGIDFKLEFTKVVGVGECTFEAPIFFDRKKDYFISVEPIGKNIN